MPTNLRLNEGWASLLFLLLLLLCVAWCLLAAEWIDGLYILPWVVLVAGVTGLVLAKSHLPNPMSHFFSALMGFAWVAWLTSRVLAASMRLTGTAAIIGFDWRIRIWLWDLFTKGKSSVGTVFLPVLALLLWLMSYFASWAVFRWHRPWPAVIVSAVVLLLNITAAGGARNLTAFLVVFLLLALLLIVRSNLATYELRWRKEQVQYGSEVIGGFLRAGLLVSVVAIGLAWVIPSILPGGRLGAAWSKASQPWRRLQDAWYGVFQDLNYRSEPQVLLITRSMAFVGTVVLTDRPIMAINAPSGRYWRARVFQQYVGSGWNNSDEDSLLLVANDPRLAAQPQFASRQLITQTVTLQERLGLGSTIVAAGQPMTLSIPVEALTSYFTPTLQTEETRSAPPAARQAAPPSWLYPRHDLAVGETYQVVSSVSTATGQELLRAGTDYPAWVVPRYLELPETLPARVRKLAQALTAGRKTAYEKVTAIEAFLRTYVYDTVIPGPRPGQDGVDYFLFQERRGYCAYYASAMVVMLRAVGVPARYVEGYSQDQRVEGLYQLNEEDSHGWPEVFFPGYGWVEFEPTASKPLSLHSFVGPIGSNATIAPSERPGNRRIEDDGAQLLELGPASQAGQKRVSLWQRLSPWGWVGIAAVIVSMAAAALLVIRSRRRTAGLTVVERVYQDLEGWAARLLRIHPQPQQTPHEFAGVVGVAVPQARSAIGQIADLYAEERFSGRAISDQDAEAAWSQTLPRMWRRWLQRQLGRPRRMMLRLLAWARKPEHTLESLPGG